MSRIDAAFQNPSIILLGVGHSGTSIIAGMLFELGWDRNDSDAQFNESVSFRTLNNRLLAGESLDRDLDDLLASLRRPFVLKDPRFVLTFPHWREAFSRLESPPLVLYLTRDSSAVAKSYTSRGHQRIGDEPGIFNKSLSELEALAKSHFEVCQLPKLHISYERVRSAVALFKQEKPDLTVEGGLWRNEAEKLSLVHAEGNQLAEQYAAVSAERDLLAKQYAALSAEFDRTARRPWRLLKSWLMEIALKTLAVVIAPLSRRSSQRFAKLARKPNSKRLGKSNFVH